MKVFYSWQLDSARKTNKDLIRSALDTAAERVRAELDLTEPERSVEIDQDTQGVLGSPPVAQTIYRKIAEADLVVCDVSLVNRREDGQGHINSNVAIELGYSLGKHGDGRLLKIMNTAGGGPEFLPFDLRERRYPVVYDVPEGSDRTHIEREHARLASALEQVLRAYMKQSSILTETHPSMPTTGNAAAYWNPIDSIVPGDNQRNRPPLFASGARMIFVRLRPRSKQVELSSLDAFNHVRSMENWSGEGHSVARNRWGAVAYLANWADQELLLWIQLFRNRELWLVDCYHAVHRSPENDLDFDFVPMGALKDRYPRYMHAMCQLVSSLGYVGEPVEAEMGVVNAKGLRLLYGTRSDDQTEVIFSDEIVVTDSFSVDKAATGLLNKFITKLFDEAGRNVPEYCLINPASE